MGFLGAVPGEKAGDGVIGPIEFLMMLAGMGPALLLWIVVIVFAAVWLWRGGGRAERFLISGASLKIIGNLLGLPAAFIVPWLVGRDYSMDCAMSVVSGYGIFVNVIGMAGIICLVYAFWVKFKARNSEGEVPLPQN
ncbi:hypothetical protein ACFLX3_00415 [Chloroflexota bacterium]